MRALILFGLAALAISAGAQPFPDPWTEPEPRGYEIRFVIPSPAAVAAKLGRDLDECLGLLARPELWALALAFGWGLGKLEAARERARKPSAPNFDYPG